VSDGDAAVVVMAGAGRQQDAQSTLELVDVDVAAAQVPLTAVELERVAPVQHAPVVEADQVARMQARLEAGRRGVQKARDGRVRRVVRLYVRLRDVQRCLAQRRPRHADDSTCLRLGDNVRMSVSVTNAAQSLRLILIVTLPAGNDNILRSVFIPEPLLNMPSKVIVRSVFQDFTLSA